MNQDILMTKLGLKDAEMSKQDIFTRTLYGEAILGIQRDQPLLMNVRAIEAIATAIINRYEAYLRHDAFWWGHSLSQFCLNPNEFSCWEISGTKIGKLLSLSTSDAGYILCKRVARRALKGAFSQSHKQATHYHRRDELPNWAKNRPAIHEVGDFWLY